MEILSSSYDNGIWGLMLPAVFISIILFVGIIDGKEKNSKFQMIICSLLIVATLIGGFLLCKFESERKILKVIITDMNQVDFNKYEITGSEGKVIKLKEK